MTLKSIKLLFLLLHFNNFVTSPRIYIEIYINIFLNQELKNFVRLKFLLQGK